MSIFWQMHSVTSATARTTVIEVVSEGDETLPALG